LHAVIYIEINVSESEIPSVIDHRIEFADSSSQITDSVTGGAIEVRKESLPALGPPLRGGPWVAIYDPSWERGHRRVYYTTNGHARLPGRYAIDWMKLDADGHYAKGDSNQVSNWYGYGADVLAVADGVIAATRDDVSESSSVSANPKHSLSDAAGNYVVIEIGRGKYATYEHLKPRSIRVKTGESVRRGEVIANLGFTGDSTGPHLHFHVADGIVPLDSEGMPYLFQNFEWIGIYDSLDKFGSEPWKAIGKNVPAHRKDEYPESKAVIKFEVE